MKKRCVTSCVLLGIGLAACTARAAPDLADHHPQVAHLVVNLMEYQHYEPHAVDDAFSAAWLDGYLEALDPNRMVFVQSDIQEFQRYSNRLDDLVRRRSPDLDVAIEIYGRYQERLQERTDAVMSILDQPIDLTTSEVWDYDPDRTTWPANAAAANDLWRMRVTNDVLISTLQAERGIARSREEIVDTIRKRYDRKLKDDLAADSGDVLEKFLSAFTSEFDPHSAYFRPATSDNFDIDISNSLEGIGARLKVDGDYTVIDSIVPGGPAALDGELQPGDRVVGVAQGTEAPEDVIGMRLDRVVRLIRGPKDTEVRLTVIPVDAPSETRVVSIVRDKVLLSESDADGSIIEHDGHRYGLIEVPSFYIDQNRPLPGGGYYGASADVRRLIGELSEQGMEGLIVDFRGNGGGSLSEAVSMAGLFIHSGPVVQIRDQSGEVEIMEDPDPSLVYDGPLMVLTDPLSASASEIVAGALQDYGRAVVVGAETTHGKGTVQRLWDLDYFLAQVSGIEARSGALKMTIQKFYRVSGGSTQNRGVRSDVVLPSYWDGLEVFESNLDNALAYDEIAAAQFRPVGNVDPVLAQLQQQSAQRVAGSEDFQSLLTELAEREAAREDTTLSLNIDTRRSELDPVEPEESTAEDATEEVDDAQRHQDDFVLQEAAAILNDWISLQRP